MSRRVVFSIILTPSLISLVLASNGSGGSSSGGHFEEVPTGGGPPQQEKYTPPPDIPRDPRELVKELRAAEAQSKKAARAMEAAHEQYSNLREQLKRAETEYAKIIRQINEDLAILRDRTIDPAKAAQIKADLATLKADLAKFDLPKLRANVRSARETFGSLQSIANGYSTVAEILREKLQVAKSYYARVFSKLRKKPPSGPITCILIAGSIVCGSEIDARAGDIVSPRAKGGFTAEEEKRAEEYLRLTPRKRP